MILVRATLAAVGTFIDTLYPSTGTPRPVEADPAGADPQTVAGSTDSAGVANPTAATPAELSTSALLSRSADVITVLHAGLDVVGFVTADNEQQLCEWATELRDRAACGD